MDIDVTTPALLFPTISLIMLAYTNRFLGLSTVIRNLRDRYDERKDPLISRQIDNLRRRVVIIRNMQILGALSLLLCIVCMLVLLGGAADAGKVIFVLSLLLMAASLALSIRELQMSVGALEINLSDMEDNGGR